MLIRLNWNFKAESVTDWDVVNMYKAEMRSNNDSYMIFVLGYDLLQKKLTSMDDCPCDVAYETCINIYNEFLDSEENQQDKSEYECLQEWIENHQGTIDRLIETNFRLMEE